jgi:hypothetical protein
MSFNKTTTNALSDEQMGELNAEIKAAAAENKTAPTDLSGVMSGLGTLNTGQGTINTGIAGVSGDVTGGFGDLNTYLKDRFGAANTDRTALMSSLGKGMIDLNQMNQGRADDLGTQLTGVGGDVTQGFADQTTRFDTLDTSVGDVQTGVDAANTGIETMGTEMGTRFDTTDQNFTEAGEALTKGFTDTQGDVAALQSESLAGQGTILSDLATAKTERDAYNVASNDAQNTMLENQTGFKSNFDDYVSRYSDDTTLQNETLGNIQTGLTGFAGDVNSSLAGLGSAVGTNSEAAAAAAAAAGANSEQVGSVASILQGGFGDINGVLQGGFNDMGGNLTSLQGGLNSLDGSLQGGINSLGSDLNSVDSNVSGLAGGIAGIAQGQGNIQNAISSGFNTSQGSLNKLGNSLGQDFGQLQSNVSNSVDSMGNEQVDYSNQFEQVTGQLKSLSQLSGLPDQMRQQFHQLGGSFDKQGNLIQNSIDEQGNTITRALDNQGNMMIRKFDASGAGMGQMVMNLNDVMGQINQLGLVPGGSAGMGNLSQPLQDLGTGNGGFMSPFGRTQ